MNELDLFAAAIAIANPAERRALLDRECAENADLRQRLVLLLDAHARSHQLLDRPNGNDPSATQAHARAATVIGSIIAGRYKLLEQIGDGGMGTVWMAEQREPVKRLVAVKLIKPGMDSKALLARFEAERQALAMMDHPNIAKVLDAGTDDGGRPFFVMELVKGLPLTEYCDARRLPVNDRLDLFVQICSAIQHAHQKAVIHRDLKPSNVLVTEHDGKPVPKVIDFGLAKALGATSVLTERTLHTAYGTVVGTPLYMAPEQVGINALDVDTRTDIYALGVILYELLTGSTPLEKARFKEAAWEEVKRLIREEEPPRPSTRLSSDTTLPSLAASRQVEPAQLRRLVRGELDWIVMKALDKDRSRRYETASGLAKDVQRHLSGEAVEACPPTLSYRLRKVYRKHRAAVLTATAFALLMVTGTVVSTWLARRAAVAEAGEKAQRIAAEVSLKVAESEKNRAIKSEADALAAKQQAEQEKANATAALDYINNDILSHARPDLEGDPDIKLRTVVDNIAASLAAKSGKTAKLPPLVEASLRHTLYSIYINLERFPEAAIHIKRAYEIRKALLGERNHETISAMVGHGYRFLWRDGVGPDKEQELINGEKVATEALGLASEVLGPDDLWTLIAMRNVGEYHSWWGRYDEAEKLYVQFYDGCVRTRGESDTWSITALNHLAWLNIARRKYSEAEVYAQRAVALRTAQSEDHYLTYTAIETLAATYAWQKQYAKAEQFQPKLIEGFRKHVGDRSLSYLFARTSYAFTLSQLEKHHEAVREYEEVIPLLRQSPDYQARRRRTQMAFDLTGYGYDLNELGRFQDAEPVLREAMEIREADLEHYHPQRSNSRSVLGVTLTGLKRYEEAEQHLLKAYEDQSKPSTTTEPAFQGRRWRISTVERLIKLYTAWEKPGKVTEWQAVLEKLNQIDPQPTESRVQN